MINRLLTASLLAATALTFATPAAAQRVDRVVGFGDSYADRGNAFALSGSNPDFPIYPQNRF
jgi:phospholipase/lecithinase/hemolysin